VVLVRIFIPCTRAGPQNSFLDVLRQYPDIDSVVVNNFNHTDPRFGRVNVTGGETPFIFETAARWLFYCCLFDPCDGRVPSPYF
jgi:hypothetical protein